MSGSRLTLAPRVTVILPFLDELRYLAGAIETVRNQDVTSWELLLVDDGSTDGSGPLAERFAAHDPLRIHVLRHPRADHRGLPASRNLGLTAAQGETIAFLDADDRWLPHKLASQLDALDQDQDVGMVCGPTWYLHAGPDDAAGVLTPVVEDAPRKYARGAFARALLTGGIDPPPPSNVMFRTSALRAVGGVPEGDNLYEDQRTFVAVSLRYPVFVTDVPLSTYAVRPDSLYGSLADDHATKWQQLQRFERWVVTWAPREGVHGMAIAAEVGGRQLRRLVRTWSGRLRKQLGHGNPLRRPPSDRDESS